MRVGNEGATHRACLCQRSEDWWPWAELLSPCAGLRVLVALVAETQQLFSLGQLSLGIDFVELISIASEVRLQDLSEAQRRRMDSRC